MTAAELDDVCTCDPCCRWNALFDQLVEARCDGTCTDALLVAYRAAAREMDLAHGLEPLQPQPPRAKPSKEPQPTPCHPAPPPGAFAGWELRALREEVHVSQLHLALVAGVRQTAVSDTEHVRAVRPATVARYLTALSCIVQASEVRS